MSTPTPDSNQPLPRSPSAPILENREEDGMATDRVTANKLPAEEQLKRFLQWLQFTDRGHQPC